MDLFWFYKKQIDLLCGLHLWYLYLILIKFLAESLDVIQDAEWMISLGNAFTGHYELYTSDDEHSALLHRYYGSTSMLCHYFWGSNNILENDHDTLIPCIDVFFVF